MSEDVVKGPKKLDPDRLSKSLKKMDALEYPSKKSREKKLADIAGKETIPPEIKS